MLGLKSLLDWLEDQPGDSWQDRWLASGADSAGRGWRDGAGGLARTAAASIPVRGWGGCPRPC